MALTFDATSKSAILANIRRLWVALGLTGANFDTSTATITDNELVSLAQVLLMFDTRNRTGGVGT